MSQYDSTRSRERFEYLKERLEENGDDYQQVFDDLMQLEKETRFAQDEKVAKELLLFVLDYLWGQERHTTLLDLVVSLTNKRVQIKLISEHILERVYEYIENTVFDDELVYKEYVLKYLEASHGKTYCELYWARITVKYSEILYEEDEKRQSFDEIMKVHTETIGQMSHDEKVKIVNIQMRKALSFEDYVNVQILSRKVTPRILMLDEVEPFRYDYYDLVSTFFIQKGRFFDAAQALFNQLKCISLEDEEERHDELLEIYENCMISILLSSRDPEQLNLLKNILDYPLSQVKNSIHKEILRTFIKKEIITTDINKKLEIFFAERVVDSKQLETLKQRVLEYNILIIAESYDYGVLSDICELIGTEIDTLEAKISEFVISKVFYARINQVEGVVNFVTPKSNAEVMDDYLQKVRTTVEKLELANHLINLEQEE
ncbi:hypothetical protein PCE1_002239 [Barthelona sp. PCE]